MKKLTEKLETKLKRTIPKDLYKLIISDLSSKHLDYRLPEDSLEALAEIMENLTEKIVDEAEDYQVNVSSELKTSDFVVIFDKFIKSDKIYGKYGMLDKASKHVNGKPLGKYKTMSEALGAYYGKK